MRDGPGFPSADLVALRPALGRESVARPSVPRHLLVSAALHLLALAGVVLAMQPPPLPQVAVPDVVDMVLAGPVGAAPAPAQAAPPSPPAIATPQPPPSPVPAPAPAPDLPPPAAVQPPPAPAPPPEPMPLAEPMPPPQPVPAPKPVDAVAPPKDPKPRRPKTHATAASKTVATAPRSAAASEAHTDSPTATAPVNVSVSRAAYPVEGLASNGKPAYPPAAQRHGEQGTVVLRVTVSPSGMAQAAVVQQSSGHPLLDDAAVAKVLRDWRFVPATRDGAPVTGSAQVTFSFELEN